LAPVAVGGVAAVAVVVWEASILAAEHLASLPLHCVFSS